MSEYLAKLMKTPDHLGFRNVCFREWDTERRAASPQGSSEPKAAGLKSRPSLLQQTARLGYALHRS